MPMLSLACHLPIQMKGEERLPRIQMSVPTTFYWDLDTDFSNEGLQKNYIKQSREEVLH